MSEITKLDVVEKLTAYLHNQLSLIELVDWAEDVMMDGDFSDKDFDLIHEVISRLGLADVRAFGLTWEDCQSYLTQLGYQAQVTVLES
ncbi:MAG: hypothetical protein GY805_20390 [Chloroflexi bacterium]|nr:hypothetical protein [Chloroflexota bacterium]